MCRGRSHWSRSRARPPSRVSGARRRWHRGPLGGERRHTQRSIVDRDHWQSSSGSRAASESDCRLGSTTHGEGSGVLAQLRESSWLYAAALKTDSHWLLVSEVVITLVGLDDAGGGTGHDQLLHGDVGVSESLVANEGEIGGPGDLAHDCVEDRALLCAQVCKVRADGECRCRVEVADGGSSRDRRSTGGVSAAVLGRGHLHSGAGHIVCVQLRVAGPGCGLPPARR